MPNINELDAKIYDKEEISSLSENEIYDFITNEPVKSSAKEEILQAVARSLVEEYGFEHTQLSRDYVIKYEIYDERGKSRKVRRKIDIVVFPENVIKDNPEEIIRACVVQSPSTKANNRKNGFIILEEIMGALSKCDYGLWTNGTDLVFKSKIVGGGRIQPEYVDLYDLPGYGETSADLDNPGRHVGRIATGDNLVRTFSRVHDYIYGNQGLKKDVAFFQLLNLIFCKIHDERTTGSRRFWVRGTERNDPEGQQAIARRIKELFEEVKNSPNYSSVFSERDAIELNDKVLAYVVGEFSRYNLLDTDVDVKGAAYEEITAATLKAQRGQFFTPTNVIRLMIEMMDPGCGKDLTSEENWPRILDPACGSGRFLTYALDHVRKKLADQLFPNMHPLLRLKALDDHPDHSKLINKFAGNYLYGIDFDPDLKRAARMNMILNNDGHGNILSFNSLEYPLMLMGKTLNDVRGQYLGVKKEDIIDSVRAKMEADLGTFDFVFTNPPFGANIPIDDPNTLEQFDLGHKWQRDEHGHWYMENEIQSKVSPEILFVERCVEWAKPVTGKIAIVLPDGLLGNPDAESIRYWILNHCQLLASIDLPVEAFLPQVGVQASLLFLRRKSQAEMDAQAMGEIEDYNIFMAVAENVGHDRRGNVLYERDPYGAERVFTVTKNVLRRRRDRYFPVKVKVTEKLIDDDLPKILLAYKEYLGQELI